jgi:hypothetical protein
MAAKPFCGSYTDKEISEIKINSVPKNTKDLCKSTKLMEQLLSSQLTELRIKSRHRQLLCGRMGYGGEVLLLQ